MAYLELRDLAQEWRELEDEMSANVPDTEGMSYTEVAEATDSFLKAPEQVKARAKYVELCEQLGCEPTPDDLERWANDYEPTLIPDGEFEDYARELAEDIGAIDRDAGWPLRCIDWKRAANELRMDYTSITFDGDDYLTRS